MCIDGMDEQLIETRQSGKSCVCTDYTWLRQYSRVWWILWDVFRCTLIFLLTVNFATLKEVVPTIYLLFWIIPLITYIALEIYYSKRDRCAVVANLPNIILFYVFQHIRFHEAIAHIDRRGFYVGFFKVCGFVAISTDHITQYILDVSSSEYKKKYLNNNGFESTNSFFSRSNGVMQRIIASNYYIFSRLHFENKLDDINENIGITPKVLINYIASVHNYNILIFNKEDYHHYQWKDIRNSILCTQKTVDPISNYNIDNRKTGNKHYTKQNGPVESPTTIKAVEKMRKIKLKRLKQLRKERKQSRLAHTSNNKNNNNNNNTSNTGRGKVKINKKSYAVPDCSDDDGDEEFELELEEEDESDDSLGYDSGDVDSDDDGGDGNRNVGAAGRYKEYIEKKLEEQAEEEKKGKIDKFLTPRTEDEILKTKETKFANMRRYRIAVFFGTSLFLISFLMIFIFLIIINIYEENSIPIAINLSGIVYLVVEIYIQYVEFKFCQFSFYFYHLLTSITPLQTNGEIHWPDIHIDEISVVHDIMFGYQREIYVLMNDNLHKVHPDIARVICSYLVTKIPLNGDFVKLKRIIRRHRKLTGMDEDIGDNNHNSIGGRGRARGGRGRRYNNRRMLVSGNVRGDDVIVNGDSSSNSGGNINDTVAALPLRAQSMRRFSSDGVATGSNSTSNDRLYSPGTVDDEMETDLTIN